MKFLKAVPGLNIAVSLLGQLSGYTAQRQARKGQKAQEEMVYQQQISADKIAKKQQKEKDAALKRVSRGRARASRRRIKGGLFGEGLSEGMSSERLGG